MPVPADGRLGLVGRVGIGKVMIMAIMGVWLQYTLGHVRAGEETIRPSDEHGAA